MIVAETICVLGDGDGGGGTRVLWSGVESARAVWGLGAGGARAAESNSDPYRSTSSFG